MRRPAAALLVATVAVLGYGEPALAAWGAGASGAGAAKARVMPAGNNPSGSVSNRNVTVSWSQSSFAGGPIVSGYVVKRYSSGGALQTIGTGCSGTIGALSCTETSVPPGGWRYSVTPKQGAWSGAESAQSTAVTVAAPSLSLSPTTVASLPSTLSGSLSSYIPSQTVSFRLDDPSVGPILSGSISPSLIPESGSSSVSVTIPAATSNGAHTVYAIGSGGDMASAAITVSAPAFVKTVGQATCGATSLSVSVPAAGVAAGDTLILRLILRGTTGGTVSALDSKGNSYAVDRDVLNVDQRAVVAHARVTTALTSGDTITVGFPGSTASGLVADEFSGIAATSPVDASGQGTGTGTSPSASVTASNAPDLLIGSVSIAAQATATQPSSWTALTGQSKNCGGAGGNSASFGAYRIVSSTGSYAYNPTSSASARWAAAVVAYKRG